jgi:hypothetical protein
MQTSVQRITAIPNANGGYTKVYTFESRMPLMILPQYGTHRVFSRSASSGRSVPGKKYRQQLSGYVPDIFPKNGKGMQPTENLGPIENWIARKLWILAYYIMCGFQWIFINVLRVHKEIANRLLNTFAWINVITTTTKVRNFEILRNHPAAQFQIRELAIHVKKAIDKAQPIKSHIHLPFIGEEEIYEVCSSMKRMDLQPLLNKLLTKNCTKLEVFKKIPLDIYMALIIMNTSMTAKGSYLNHFQPEALDGHFKRYHKLVKDKPIHASPAESCAMSYSLYKFLVNRDHQAGNRYNLKVRPLDDLCGNFNYGIVQFRKTIEDYYED